MLSPPTVGRKMQICTLIHTNLESQTPSLFTIHSKASLCISRYALGRACDERKQGKNGVVEGSERVSESERAGWCTWRSWGAIHSMPPETRGLFPVSCLVSGYTESSCPCCCWQLNNSSKKPFSVVIGSSKQRPPPPRSSKPPQPKFCKEEWKGGGEGEEGERGREGGREESSSMIKCSTECNLRSATLQAAEIGLGRKNKNGSRRSQRRLWFS